MTIDPKALEAARETKAVEPTLDQNALLAADDVWRMITVGPMTTNILARCITAYLTHAQPAIERAARDLALEEAAEIAFHTSPRGLTGCIAAAILALKEPRT